MDKYFLIYNTEDGVQTRGFDSANELQDWFDDNEFEVTEWVGPEHDWETTDSDTAMLIRGEVLTPKPKKVVKSWDLK